ncbi:MAG: hypothetical protein JF587_10370 [Catenulisporales bacterium]|nr:hypothetical protein [Catenulisporales bacterium]
MTLMGTGAGEFKDITDTEDMDWARDLFDRARAGGEPLWSGADVAVIARSGNRRRRLRALGTGGGLLGVAAVTVAVAVTLGAGTTDAGQAPGPGGGWGGRPLRDVFHYARITSSGTSSGNVDIRQHVPKTAAADVAALIGRLDPAGAHLRGEPDGPTPDPPRIVSDDEPALKQVVSITLGSTWTADGSAPAHPVAPARPPYARVSYAFFNDVNVLRGGGIGLSSNTRPQPCGYSVDQVLTARMSISPAPPPQWSACRRTVLSDGSTVGVTSARFGAGMETVAVRVFGSGNVVALLGWDYSAPRVDITGPADAGSVVTPAPWTEDSIVAALSDPEIKPVLPPRPRPNVDTKMLTPSDLGTDWNYDLTKGEGFTNEFVMDNGCAPDASIFGLADGKALNYAGNLPDGTPATAFEGEYRLPAGTGAQTMRDARKNSQGGCDPNPTFGFSKDTMSDLPAGIGDGAFIENQPQQGTVRVSVRFGDTILQTIINRDDHKTLDLTSAAGKAWLEGIARQMAAHWTGQSPGVSVVSSPGRPEHTR